MNERYLRGFSLSKIKTEDPIFSKSSTSSRLSSVDLSTSLPLEIQVNPGGRMIFKRAVKYASSDGAGYQKADRVYR
jgi:hypothetical protein